jgi:hypothetical protein
VDSSTADEQPAGNDTGTVDQATSSTDGPAHDGGDAVAPGDGPPVDTGLPNPLGISWCSVNVDPATIFCDDFDEGRVDMYATDPPGAAISINQGGGAGGINKTDHSTGSAPASLDIITVCTGTSLGPLCQATASQYQYTYGVQAPKGLIFSFDLKIEDFDVNAGDVSLVTIGNGSFAAGGWRVSLDYAGGTGPSNNNQFLQYFIGDGGAATNIKTVIEFPDFTDPCNDDEGGAPEAGADAGEGGICVGGWVTIQIMVDFFGTSDICVQSGGPCATITYNGESAIVGGGTIIPIDPPPMTTVDVLYGANYIQQPAKEMHLQYDNLKIDALP